jgi:hypothetical protein
MLQRYANVPAVENLRVKVLLGAMSPESKPLSTAVTVWVLASWFVQVTVDPVFTVNVLGPKAKFLMVAALAVVGPDGAPAADVPPPHPASRAPAMMAGQTGRIMCRVMTPASGARGVGANHLMESPTPVPGVWIIRNRRRLRS